MTDVTAEDADKVEVTTPDEAGEDATTPAEGESDTEGEGGEGGDE